MKTKIPITYTGSNTENLYVLGIRNGREVKLKVKEIGCHGPIKVNEIAEDSSYNSYSELSEAALANELTENTVYVINEGGVEVRYIYYNGVLSPLSNTTNIVSGLEVGKSFATFQELKDAQNNSELDSQKIYLVTDRGTIEQYIFADDKLIQIAGAINEITNGNTEDEEKSITEEDSDGIIDYNLSELVNGDYRFKNHANITTVYCDMSSLVSGVQMFYGTSLTSFCGDLSSLSDGRWMFAKGCKLDENSIISIVDGIKDWSSDASEHVIGIGYNSSEVSASFIVEIEKEFIAKGWLVHWYKDGMLEVRASK